MDFTLAITKNRAALVRLMAVRCATVGLNAEGDGASKLKRYIRSNVLHLLRPAESAFRRLVIAEARELPASIYKPRPAPTQPILRGDGSGRAPVFKLIDPRKQFETRTRRYARAPQITLIGWGDWRPEPPKPEPKPGDLMDARLIARRVTALKSALENLPKQAKRLVRLRARRKLSAMRPGRPPGYRNRVRFEVDEVLTECQWLAFEALKAPFKV